MESSERQQAIMAALDVLDAGICITDEHGRLLYQNASLRRQLLADPGQRVLDETMSDARLTVLARAHAEARHGREGNGAAESRARAVPANAADRSCKVALQTKTEEGAQYLVEAAALAGAVPGIAHLVVITVQCRGSRRLSPQSLRAVYGLTAREVRVASLLDAGARNREIAESLNISLHTARRHAESVLRKLGVHSRSEVRRRLTEENPADDAH